jgi:hypothetical protein
MSLTGGPVFVYFRISAFENNYIRMSGERVMYLFGEDCFYDFCHFIQLLPSLCLNLPESIGLAFSIGTGWPQTEVFPLY